MISLLRPWAFPKPEKWRRRCLFLKARQLTVPCVDGFTVDQNDHIYAACWGRGYMAVIDTATMQIKRHIDIPTRIPASCCFAGEHMDELIIVTEALGADTDKDPNAGVTFICEADTKGRTPFLFG